MSKVTNSKWWPTNKWWVATWTSAATVAGLLWVGDGINTDSEKLILISLIAQRLIAYSSRNEPEVQVVVPPTNGGQHDIQIDVSKPDRRLPVPGPPPPPPQRPAPAPQPEQPTEPTEAPA